MNTKIIGNQQTNVISFVKNYIFRCKKIGVDVANSSICYFINSANSSAISRGGFLLTFDKTIAALVEMSQLNC